MIIFGKLLYNQREYPQQMTQDTRVFFSHNDQIAVYYPFDSFEYFRI